MPASVQFIQATASTEDLSTYTFNAVSLGDAAPDRHIVVSVHSRRASSSPAIASASVQGVAANIVRQGTSSVQPSLIGILIAPVPLGASGDIVLSFTHVMLRAGIAVYCVRGIDPASVTTDFRTGTPISTSVVVPANGIAISSASSANPEASASWAGVSLDNFQIIEKLLSTSNASGTFAEQQSPLSIECTFPSPLLPIGCSAAWGPSSVAGANPLMLQSNVISQFSGFPMIAKKSGKISAANEVELWTPADTTTALWLDAADSSTLFDAVSGGGLVAADGSVAKIEDKSGNARHFTQGAPASRPVRKASIQNGKDVLRCDGSDDWMETTFATWGTNYAVVLIGLSTTTAASQGFFVCRSNSTVLPVNPQVGIPAVASTFLSVRDDAGNLNQTNQTGFAANTFYLIGGTRDGSAVASMRNGVLSAISSNSLGAITTNRSTIGAFYSGSATPSGYLKGDIGEVIVCGLSDRQIVEGYAAWKWGLQGSLPADHPYKNAAPTR